MMSDGWNLAPPTASQRLAPSEMSPAASTPSSISRLMA